MIEHVSEQPDTPGARSKSGLSPNVRKALATLRGKIRRYVTWQGILLAAVWLCLTYWVALALDYLPVLLGFSELSVVTRTLLLCVIALGFAYILYRQVFQRVRRSLNDSSLALLLERKFPEFGDSLVTTVQASESPTDDPAVSPLSLIHI